MLTLRNLATQLLERMGLDQTTAIDIFFRQIIAERRLPFQPIVNTTLDEQIVAAVFKRNPKRVRLGIDADSNILLNKEVPLEIQDWAVNG